MVLNPKSHINTCEEDTILAGDRYHQFSTQNPPVPCIQSFAPLVSRWFDAKGPYLWPCSDNCPWAAGDSLPPREPEIPENLHASRMHILCCYLLGRERWVEYKNLLTWESLLSGKNCHCQDCKTASWIWGIIFQVWIKQHLSDTFFDCFFCISYSASPFSIQST